MKPTASSFLVYLIPPHLILLSSPRLSICSYLLAVLVQARLHCTHTFVASAVLAIRHHRHHHLFPRALCTRFSPSYTRSKYLYLTTDLSRFGNIFGLCILLSLSSLGALSSCFNRSMWAYNRVRISGSRDRSRVDDVIRCCDHDLAARGKHTTLDVRALHLLFSRNRLCERDRGRNGA